MLKYWSVQIHATRKQLTAHEREGAYIVKSEVLRPMQTDATSANNSHHCWVLLANNVTSVCMGLKVWPVSNYTQQVPTLLWLHANGRNKSQHCWAQQCWVLLANNVESVCMGLYPRPWDKNLSPYCTVNKDLKQLNSCVSFCFAWRCVNMKN